MFNPRYAGTQFLNFALFLCTTLFCFQIGTIYAEEDKSVAKVPDRSEAVVGDALLPDLFTGAMGYRIPIDIPQIRNGLTPNLSLTYRSTNGNSWVGFGWELEAGAIERSTRNGLYQGDNFVFRRAGSTVELVSIGNEEFRAKIEGEFLRFKRLDSASSGGSGKAWIITDTKGVTYYYGQSSATRQHDPNDATREFKWCIDRVEDPNGNYITFSYNKDQGQIYLDQVSYTGNSNISLTPTNYVKFYREPSPVVTESYTPHFKVKTAYRLKTIDIVTNGNRVRSYKATYTGENATPPVSLLSWFQEFGRDTQLSEDGSGTIISGNSLPATSFNYSAEQNGFKNKITQLYDYSDANQYGYKISSDFNGDGTTDLIKLGNDGNIYVQLADKSGFVPLANWGPVNLSGVASPAVLYSLFDDLNADGKADYLLIGANGNLSVAYSNGATFGTRQNWGAVPLGDSVSYSRYAIVDIKGDGNKAVLFIGSDGSQRFTYYNSTSLCSGQTCTIVGDGTDPLRYRYADFNGDGKTDVLYIANNGDLWVALSNGTNFDPAQKWQTFGNGDASRYLLGDFNGDGLADLLYIDSNHDVSIALSSGQSFVTPVKWATYGDGNPANYRSFDMNGDGRSDLIYIENYFRQNIGLSTGNSFVTPSYWGELGVYDPGNPPRSDCNRYIDINGDGKRDIHTCNVPYSTGYIRNFEALLSFEGKANLLTGISNGIGGLTQIEYTLFEDYFSHKSIGPFYVVKSIKSYSNSNFVCDANNVCSWQGAGTPLTTDVNYAGGYYHYANKEFRGFNHAIVSGPTGSNGERIITETWFHQGDETTVDANNPNAPIGFMKGKPYRTRISDNSSPPRIYSETETSYILKTSSPNYFAPPFQIDTYICDGNATVSCKGSGNARRTMANYTFDDYGNISREDRYGDVANSANAQLNMTITHSFVPNVSNGNWLTSFPATESIYQGIGSSDSGNNLKVSHTDFFYDDLASGNCNATPTNNQQPDRGNLTRISRWLKDGIPSETRTAYDISGNPVCSRDPNGNVTITGYDTSFQTFPISNTNAKSQVTTSSFYGVGVAADNGLFGQLKSITDPNNAAATLEYDSFGRVTKDIQPDNFWTSTAYNSFGTAGSQNIYSSNQLGMWSASYFDGLGRTTKVRSSGPDNKVIAVDATYDLRGLLNQVSSPYFDGAETPIFHTYSYDVVGRPTKITNQDSTFTLACYNDLVTASIDENGHKKRETKDPLGRLVAVEEYEGTYTSCDTSPGTPYASTTYTYDVLGNLTGVTDANQKSTTITYDTLGRKKTMTDPDMGYWQYGYYADGSLYSVTDAKNQVITFDIDVLNRPTNKHYPVVSGMTDVVYNYDELSSTNPKGRLTSMTDDSGSATYHYDLSGRINRTIKRVNNTDYTISAAYDGLGRIDSITYPNNEKIGYYYDNAGNLTEITGYAEYDEYNALGQPGKLYHGNGIVTSYWYYPKNNRLLAIKTDRLQDTLLYRTYNYDNKGNLTLMQDLASPAIPQTASPGSTGYTYWPDNAHRLQGISSRPTAVFDYDSNGNLKSDGQRTITYTPDNMPKEIIMGNATTSFTYDGNGQRAKKVSPNGTRFYIGKLHGCTDAVCGNYIYAGNTRIAYSQGELINFYHPDHLGSTSILTDNNANILETIAYYPFGETRQDSSNQNVIHKYTGQELDYEVGLYNYGARLYDPEIGRFMTPDSIVPYPTDPQSLNRYSYVQNNPVNRIDPSGNFDFEFGGFNFCIFGCDGGSGGGSGGSYSSNNSYDASMNLYLSPGSYNYNFNSGFGGDSSISFGSGHSPGLNSHSANISSNSLLLATVPGQQYFDYAYNSFKNGDYGYAALYGTAMVAEQTMFALSLGTSSLTNKSAGILSNSAPRAIAPAKRMTGQTVLGHYPDYVTLSDKLGARRFEIPTTIWEKMAADEVRWGANQRFLDRTIARGDDIILATPISKVNPGSFYERELNYLFNKGYQLNIDGSRLILGR